jgi:uncharacterized protein YpmB
MFKSLAKNKSLLLTIIVLVLLFVIYNSFFKSETTSFVVDPQVKAIGADIVKTYADLQSVTLDEKLFSNPAYTNLTDFGVEIPSQAVGRVNPFDLLGR